MENLRYIQLHEEFGGVALVVQLDGGGCATSVIRRGDSVHEVVHKLRTLAENLEYSAAERARLRESLRWA